MERVVLQMDFYDAFNKTFRITVEEPLEELAQSEIESAMDSIITYNVFNSNGVNLVSKKSARILTTLTNTMTFE